MIRNNGMIRFDTLSMQERKTYKKLMVETPKEISEDDWKDIREYMYPWTDKFITKNKRKMANAKAVAKHKRTSKEI